MSKAQEETIKTLTEQLQSIKAALSKAKKREAVIFTTESQEKQTDVHTNFSSAQKAELLTNAAFVRKYVVSDSVTAENKHVVVLKNEVRDLMRRALDNAATYI